MTLYKLIKPGETIPENAVIFSHSKTPMQSPRVGEEFDPESFFYTHFVPVEVPDKKPGQAPLTEEIPLGPIDRSMKPKPTRAGQKRWLPYGDDPSNGTMIRCMADAEGWLLVRRPGAKPFAMWCAEFERLALFEPVG